MQPVRRRVQFALTLTSGAARLLAHPGALQTPRCEEPLTASIKLERDRLGFQESRDPLESEKCPAELKERFPRNSRRRRNGTS